MNRTMPSYIKTLLIAGSALGTFLFSSPSALTYDDQKKSSPADNAQALIGFVPETAESVFCIEDSFNIKALSSNVDPSVFKAAVGCSIRLTITVAKSLQLDFGDIKCAVGACQGIDLPASNAQREILTGPFSSHRLEILLLDKDLEDGWLKSLLSHDNATNVTIAGYESVLVAVKEDHILISKPAPRLLLFSNDETLLKKALGLKQRKSQNDTGTISQDTGFRRAQAVVAKSAGFWGVRLFGRSDPDKDPTTIRNPKNMAGFFDLGAEFAGASIAKSDADYFELYYASSDPDHAWQFRLLVDKITEKINNQSSLDKASRFVILSAKCGSDRSKDLEIPAYLNFFIVTAMLGQSIVP